MIIPPRMRLRTMRMVAVVIIVVVVLMLVMVAKIMMVDHLLLFLCRINYKVL